MDSLYYPPTIAPFSSDESRIRRRCVGGQLALVTKTVADLGIWAHLRPVSDCLLPTLRANCLDADALTCGDAAMIHWLIH
jgi:hypothetical protein